VGRLLVAESQLQSIELVVLMMLQELFAFGAPTACVIPAGVACLPSIFWAKPSNPNLGRVALWENHGIHVVCFLC